MHSRDEDDVSHPYLATLTDDGHVDPVVPPAALFLATTLFSNQTLQNPLPTNFTIFSGVCVSKLVRGGVAKLRCPACCYSAWEKGRPPWEVGPSLQGRVLTLKSSFREFRCNC